MVGTVVYCVFVGYDVDGCIIFTFSKGQKACCTYSSKIVTEANSACIYGTKGYIEVGALFVSK